MEPTGVLDIFRAQGLRPPKTLTLSITGICNLACAHCWVVAGEADSAANVPKSALHRMIEEFAAIGGEGIRITGGEPLCHPGWLDLIRFARKLGMRTILLQTNGMLFNDESVASLRELDFPGLSIQLGIDGASAPVHDLTRGAGAFQGFLDGIGYLLRGGLGPRITFLFTEMSHNLADIPAVLELADQLQISSVVSGTLIQGGRAAAGALIAPPTAEQYLELLDRHDSDPRFRELYSRQGNVATLGWGNSEAVREECCTFAENPYLTPRGRLYPCLLCHADDYSVTGVFEKGFIAALTEGAPVWASLMRISRCRADALTACRDCSGRDSCAGGCMGRAWGSRGNLLTEDDRCGARRAIYGRKKTSSHGG
ncbi:MAG: radical SAM protein [Steroidobacteraceae bacterium]|nr:radical SAM protein [Deltaproteobacteria bacterium]